MLLPIADLVSSPTPSLTPLSAKQNNSTSIALVIAFRELLGEPSSSKAECKPSEISDGLTPFKATSISSNHFPTPSGIPLLISPFKPAFSLFSPSSVTIIQTCMFIIFTQFRNPLNIALPRAITLTKSSSLDNRINTALGLLSCPTTGITHKPPRFLMKART
ncbi:hypothetical protein CIPAW_06G054000 [Carya illinoinensis]|uniref:Uncharacterized protein n=1 Tax=Carya illinoinensis TaxID=32201 RepID=A0A8T1Q852_CARIL|nr:hypothetical protein CIPAW_06G054000 [Carya illinoinensis]